MSDNVFADLGFPDAETRLAKAELARAIRKVVSGRKQREIAAILGLAQSDVSDLLRGKLRRFSLDRLTALLGRLGLEARVQLALPQCNCAAKPPTMPVYRSEHLLDCPVERLERALRGAAPHQTREET